MSERDTPMPAAPSEKGSRPITRSEVIDAATRLVARRGDHRMPWSAIAYEAGNEQAALAVNWFEDTNALVDECYARTAQAFTDSLLRAETAPGTAIDKVAAFLVAALEARRERGSLLSFRRGRDLPQPLQRRLHERDMMVRTRLKRLLSKGRRDGSLALRNLDSACELILASLQTSDVAVDGPEQRMWDSELVELLLAALAEPHPPEIQVRKDVDLARGACLCDTVRYELTGPFEMLSHCRCSLCRKDQASGSAAFVTVPLAHFRWISGEDAITTYQSGPYGKRSFCSRCGSVTPVAEPDAGVVFCPAGNLDGELGGAAHAHRFAGAKAPWHLTTDALAQHEEV